MSTDRELLEWAAKAHGKVEYVEGCGWINVRPDGSRGAWWHPLDDKGDSFDLQVRLHLTVNPYQDGVFVSRFEGEAVIAEPLAAPGVAPEANLRATRRAIVRAAAEIGKAMP